MQGLRISGIYSRALKLFGVDVMFQKYSLVENDTGSHRG
jgi:hypothetical protein